MHGCVVYTERAEMAAVFWWHQPCQRCKYTSSVDIPPKKTRYKKLFTHVESHASAVSLLESGEQRYIKAINNNIKQSETWVNILFVNENTHLTATGREIKH